MFGNKKEAPVGQAETRIRTIGLAGCGRGVGTSHLAISLANYLTGVKRKKTALLECSGHSDFSAIERFAGQRGTAPEKRWTGSDQKQSERGKFRIMEVDYYKMADSSVLSFCLGQDYRYIVIDYGEADRSSLCECARCDRKILVGSLSEWRAEAFLEGMEQAEKGNKGWKMALVSGGDDTRREVEHMFRCRMYRIPASADAFRVTREKMSCFEKLLFE